MKQTGTTFTSHRARAVDEFRQRMHLGRQHMEQTQRVYELEAELTSLRAENAALRDAASERIRDVLLGMSA